LPIGDLQPAKTITTLFDDASLKLLHTRTTDAKFHGEFFERHRIVRKQPRLKDATFPRCQFIRLSNHLDLAPPQGPACPKLHSRFGSNQVYGAFSQGSRTEQSVQMR
jgi:hypothetical protein